MPSVAGVPAGACAASADAARGKGASGKPPPDRPQRSAEAAAPAAVSKTLAPVPAGLLTAAYKRDEQGGEACEAHGAALPVEQRQVTLPTSA